MVNGSSEVVLDREADHATISAPGATGGLPASATNPSFSLLKTE